jgi:hypothetical protein
MPLYKFVNVSKISNKIVSTISMYGHQHVQTLASQHYSAVFVYDFCLAGCAWRDCNMRDLKGPER